MFKIKKPPNPSHTGFGVWLKSVKCILICLFSFSRNRRHMTKHTTDKVYPQLDHTM